MVHVDGEGGGTDKIPVEKKVFIPYPSNAGSLCWQWANSNNNAKGENNKNTFKNAKNYNANNNNKKTIGRTIASQINVVMFSFTHPNTGTDFQYLLVVKVSPRCYLTDAGRTLERRQLSVRGNTTELQLPLSCLFVGWLVA